MSGPKKLVSFSIPSEMTARIDALMEALPVSAGMRDPTRADVVAMLLLRGLDVIERDPEVLTEMRPKIGRKKTKGRG